MFEKIISVPLSVVYYFIFGGLMGLFHPIQWICIHVFNKKWHKEVVDFLNFLILGGLKYTLANRIKFSGIEHLPKGVPLILAANHQSLYDIPPMIWHLRDFSPKFIGKKELGKGLPSISINLRNNGCLLIDRKNPSKALQEMEAFAQRAQQHNHTIVIFPEGTRARDGKLKPFKTNGLLTMMKQMQGGYIVPMSIENSWKLIKWGGFPMGLNNEVRFTIHPPMLISATPSVEDVEAVRSVIANALGQA